jgi:hypothetical protein
MRRDLFAVRPVGQKAAEDSPHSKTLARYPRRQAAARVGGPRTHNLTCQYLGGKGGVAAKVQRRTRADSKQNCRIVARGNMILRGGDD